MFTAISSAIKLSLGYGENQRYPLGYVDQGSPQPQARAKHFECAPTAGRPRAPNAASAFPGQGNSFMPMRALILATAALLAPSSAHAINARYAQQLERWGCTQVTKARGCDIHKTKASG